MKHRLTTFTQQLPSLAIIKLLFITACSTTVNHGIIIKDRDISVIKPKLTRQADVKTILGEPSFVWQEKWYYVSTTAKQRAFFTPKVEKHEVFAILFRNNVVEKVDHFTKADIIHTPIKTQKIKVEKPNLYELFE